jgi:p-cumate 2,3-dioxygenase beta subunit
MTYTMDGPVSNGGSNKVSRVATVSRYPQVRDPELRARIEDFLYYEATLLDEWRLDAWLELLTEDATYTIPSTDAPDGDPREALPLLNDDITRIRARVTRLKSRLAHREFPTSRTRRLIGNVRIVEVRDDEVDITANFVVYRIRRSLDPYVGRYLMTLVRDGESFLIRRRRAELDLETLQPHGTVSFIL